MKWCVEGVHRDVSVVLAPVTLFYTPRIAISALSHPFPSFQNHHRPSLLNALLSGLSLLKNLTPLNRHPSRMPNTATRNIDTIIDGQLYIGKCVSTTRRHLFFARVLTVIHSPYRTVSPPPSPSTSADSLASRTSSPRVRTFLCRDLTIWLYPCKILNTQTSSSTFLMRVASSKIL